MTRFDLNIFCVFSKKTLPGKLHCTFFFSPETLALLLFLKAIEPSLDRRMIKLLTLVNLFPPRRH